MRESERGGIGGRGGKGMGVRINDSDDLNPFYFANKITLINLPFLAHLNLNLFFFF